MSPRSEVGHLGLSNGKVRDVDGRQALSELSSENSDSPEGGSLRAFLTSRLPLALVRIDKRAGPNQRSTYCRVFNDIDQAELGLRQVTWKAIISTSSTMRRPKGGHPGTETRPRKLRSRSVPGFRSILTL